MDTDKVLQFLQKIADQLGPVGVQAYNIIKARVIAESIISIIVGAVVIVIGVPTALWCFRYAKNYEGHADNDEVALVAGFFILIISILAGAAFVIPSFIDLISSDYATIQRILSLVANK